MRVARAPAVACWSWHCNLTTDARRRRAAAPVALGLATTLIVLAGCDNLSVPSARLRQHRGGPDHHDPGLPGVGRRGGPRHRRGAEVRIKRVVRYQGGEPDNTRYEIKGSELVLDTDCGARCSDLLRGDGARGCGRAGRDQLRQRRAEPGRRRGPTGWARATCGSPARPARSGWRPGPGNIEVSEAAAAVRLRAVFRGHHRTPAGRHGRRRGQLGQCQRGAGQARLGPGPRLQW